MIPAVLLRHGLGLLVPVLVPIAIASTAWLYLYTVFQQCAFPLPPPRNADAAAAFADTYARHWPFNRLPPGGPWAGNATLVPRAPFRLLALGDPQLEGDTSIPNIWYGTVPHLKKVWRHATWRSQHPNLWQRVQQTLHDWIDFWFEDIPNEIESVRKRIDLFGNDFYLNHVYRTLHWWTKPTHVTVLGDLVGSQWIDDAEFDRRGWRYWNRVFKGAERVPDDLALYPAEEYDLAAELVSDGSEATEEQLEALGAWSRRLINIAGNHDIGYAGDLTEERIERFERVFGKANYELRFELPVQDAVLNTTLFDEETNVGSDRLPPEIRVVVLNDMNLDTPAISGPLQDATYAFLNKVISTASAVEFEGHFTIVLTHVPLYKPGGICVDAPFFDFFSEEEGGGLREQNQLSADASKGFLEGVFGLSGDPGAAGHGKGRRGVLLNGHDHEGCDTYHFINQTAHEDDATQRGWEVQTWRNASANSIVGMEGHPGVREITVRSMMGDFGGYAGLLSVWFDEDAWEWKYEYASCSLGRPALWWTVHITDLVLVGFIIVWAVMAVLGIGKEGVANKAVKRETSGAEVKREM